MRPRLLQRTALMAALAAALALASSPSRADVIANADMLRGISISPEQCSSLPFSVWVARMGRGFCVRYYLSTAGGADVRPVVFLQGDRFGRLNLRTGEFERTDDKDVDTAQLQKNAEFLSRQSKTTGIYLARLGVDGSSGDHRARHTVLELYAIDAALDAIKRKHGFEGFHLVGQSGGSLLVGGLLAQRQDIGCAVLGAGRLAAPGPLRRANDAALEYYDVAHAIPTIAQRPARIVVITDPADKKVPEGTQTPFVNALREHGGKVEQLIVQATDDNRHSVAPYARLAMADCVRGAPPEELARNVRQLVERRLTAKERAEQQRASAVGE